MHAVGRGRRLLSCALVVLAFGLIEASTAVAQRAGSFDCRATALRVGSGESVVANPAGTPCRTDGGAAADTTVPLGGGNFVRVIALESRTQSNPSPTAEGTTPFLGHGGGAQSGIAAVGIRLGTTNIVVGVLGSRTSVVCGTHGSSTSPPPVMTVHPSFLAAVAINNQVISVSQPLTLPIPGVGTLYVNRTQRTGNSLTQRALELDLPGTANDIVVAESRVGFTGNPCRPG